MKHADYIVLGCGGIGSAVLYRLAKAKGARVLGLEQFTLGHDRGSSEDHSRIIRLSYHEQCYTQLLPHAYAAWDGLENDWLRHTGKRLDIITPTGGLEIAPKVGARRHELDNYAHAMRAAGIEFQRADRQWLERSYPQFRFEEEVDVLFQAHSGIVCPYRGNKAHRALAKHYGARIYDNTPVLGIRALSDRVEVRTPAGTFECGTLICTAGAWSDKVLGELGVGLRLTITQEQVAYFVPDNLAAFAPGVFPVFAWLDDPDIYGFPVFGEPATKAAIDVGGAPVTDPDKRDFAVDQAGLDRLSHWLQQHLPGFAARLHLAKTCLYDMPPDRNFVLDRVPGAPQILVFNGAAHSYKFAALMGRMLCDLAVLGGTEHNISAFSLQRPALRDAGVTPRFHI
jgi:sarcosine oxidase